MTPERWKRIDNILQSALDVPREQRDEFLNEACAGDPSLRKEIDSLLALTGGLHDFIESPAIEVAARALAEDQGESATTRATLANASRPTGRPRFLWVVLLAGAVGLACYVFSGWFFYRNGGLFLDIGWNITEEGSKQYVSEVDPDGAAANKLQIGDQLLAFNDDTRVSRFGTWYCWRLIAPGSLYTLLVMRDGAEHRIELVLPPPKLDGNLLRTQLVVYALSFVYFALAMLIGILKPHDRRIQFAFGAFWGFAMNNLGEGIGSSYEFLYGFEYYTFFLIWIISGWPLSRALVYHFVYRFSSGVPEGRLWSLIGRAFYAVTALEFVYYTYLNILLLTNNLFVNYMNSSLSNQFRISWWDDLVSPVGYLCICAVMVRNYRLVKVPDQRRRIKWLVLGLVAGLLPVTLILLLETLSFSFEDYNSWFVALVIIWPLSWCYAILKHRVLGINVLIRRGTQYLLAKNVLGLILALPLIGLVYGIISNPDRSLKEMLFKQPLYLLLVAAAALSLKFRHQLRAWVDRRFFREAYNQEQLLLRLLEEIKEFTAMPELFRLLSQQLEAALHPAHLYIFYREAEKRDLTLGHSSGGTSPLTSVPSNAQLIRLLEGQAKVQEYPSPYLDHLPAGERAWLDQLKIALLVPMIGTDGRVVGLLLLGEKRSEQPYMANDRRLLQAIARQIAVVYENVWLRENVHKEVKIRQEVLAHLEGQRISLVKECPACGTCYDGATEVCALDGDELMLTLPIERTIEGKYRLERLLGKGGMGAVYQATDLRLRRLVAVKIITGSLFGDQAALRRFEREARASAMLNHPHIVAVYDYGLTGTGGAYLVMEQIVGETLRDEINRAGCLLPLLAAEWFDQLLSGVSAAHTVGVIHRDLKPENILLATEERGRVMVKILDFGLAKLRYLDPAAISSLTMPGMVMGTLNYMSPEQLAGEDVDERGDIFSLGVITVEALTGIRPFSGKTCSELLADILQRPYHLPGNGQEVARLDSVLQKCLAKDREQRFSTVAELQQKLIPAVRTCPPFGALRRAGESR